MIDGIKFSTCIRTVDCLGKMEEDVVDGNSHRRFHQFSPDGNMVRNRREGPTTPKERSLRARGRAW